MNYKMIGVVKKIGEKVQITEKFAKQEINIETNSKYPEVIQFEFINDKTSLIETVAVNDAVEISFDIRGREWNGKFFTRLQGFDCDILERAKVETKIQADEQADDDLPF